MKIEFTFWQFSLDTSKGDNDDPPPPELAGGSGMLMLDAGGDAEPGERRMLGLPVKRRRRG